MGPALLCNLKSAVGMPVQRPAAWRPNTCPALLDRILIPKPCTKTLQLGAPTPVPSPSGTNFETLKPCTKTLPTLTPGLQLRAPQLLPKIGQRRQAPHFQVQVRRFEALQARQGRVVLEDVQGAGLVFELHAEVGRSLALAYDLDSDSPEMVCAR